MHTNKKEDSLKPEMKVLGYGYASEAISQILTYAFNELNLSKVIAETQTANLSSCRLLEKVGMKLEQTILRYGAEQAIYGIEK